MFVDKLSAQPIGRWAAMPITQGCEAALSSKYFCRKLSAVFRGHHSLQGLQDGRHHAPIVFKLFSAIFDLGAGLLADVLIVSTFVGVLKSTPSADVLNKNPVKVGVSTADIGDEILKTLPSVKA